MIRAYLRYFLLLFAVFAVHLSSAQSYKYFRVGNLQDLPTKPVAGIAMMGEGSDLDEAFRWLCDKGKGGDVLVLRARGGR